MNAAIVDLRVVGVAFLFCGCCAVLAAIRTHWAYERRLFPSFMKHMKDVESCLVVAGTGALLTSWVLGILR